MSSKHASSDDEMIVHIEEDNVFNDEVNRFEEEVKIHSEKQKPAKDNEETSKTAKITCADEAAANTTFQPLPRMIRPINIVASKLKVERMVWNPDQTGIQWQTMSDLTLAECTEEIIYMLKDDKPKNIAVCFYQGFIGKHTNKEIQKSINKISEVAKTRPIHCLVFGTVFFPPENEDLWTAIGALNTFIRRTNLEEMDLPTLNTHKSLMKPGKFSATLQCKGTLWQEFLDGTGLGHTLSLDGQIKYAQWIIRHFKKGGF